MLTPPDTSWFNPARFGLFLHWGLYSILAKGEWTMFGEKIPAAEYAKLADRFLPTKFDADQWMAHATSAGMRYAVLTTRHHEGFCLWDTATTNFSSVRSPARRDFVADYVKAARNAGLRVGLYYSLLDWCFPAYANGPVKDPAGWHTFIEYIHAQVRELCTNYGKIDVLWFDGCWPYDAPAWRAEELTTMIRTLQPGILINDRTGLRGDFTTPENAITPDSRLWESCQTSQSTWGYHADEKVLSLWDTLNKLCTCASMGGNFLLNVGPKPDGTFPQPCLDLLGQIGAWLKIHGDGIYNSQPMTKTYNYHLATRSADTLYLHFRWGEGLHWPNYGPYTIYDMTDPVADVFIPATGEKVPFTWNKETGHLTITVPPKYPEPFGTVAVRLRPR